MSPALRELGLDLVVCSSGQEVLKAVEQDSPALALIDADMPDVSGDEVAKRIKSSSSSKVVLVLGKRINQEQMRRVADSGCDEVLIAPMRAEELYDAIAIQLGLNRRGAESYTIRILLGQGDGAKEIEGQVTNMSVDGARMVLAAPLAEDAKLTVELNFGGETPKLAIPAKAVWADARDGKTIVGASFDGLDDATRARLAALTQWELVSEPERLLVVMKGDFTEATRFDGLLPSMVGRVDFDMSQVTYMNSLGVREWCNFLRAAPIQGYQFHACSVSFVLQASMVEGVLGRGTVTSFFAPYHCEECDHQEEKLLQSATVLAAEDLAPPVFNCPSCDGEVLLDDIPERYLAFLRPPESDS